MSQYRIQKYIESKSRTEKTANIKKTYSAFLFLGEFTRPQFIKKYQEVSGVDLTSSEKSYLYSHLDKHWMKQDLTKKLDPKTKVWHYKFTK